MTCRFFRLTVIGTDETKMNAIKTWFESQVDSQDIVLGDTGVSLEEDIYEAGIYRLGCDLYLDLSVNVDKYTDLVIAHSNQLDKNGLTSIKVVQYDNCSHDEENPQPCSPDVRFNWSN